MKTRAKNRKARRARTPAPVTAADISDPPKLVFDLEKVAKRLGYIEWNETLSMLFGAIDDAQAMAGSIPPDECDLRRADLQALKETVAFVFGTTVPG